jgi:hypothetical protein
MASYDIALVDEIRKRLDATYEEALAGLREGDGDLLLALAAIERRRREERGAAQGGELIGQAIGLAREGKLDGMRVKLGDRVLRDVPLPKGVGGAVLGAVLSNILSQLAIDLVRRETEEAAAEEVAAEDVATEELE